MSVLLFWPPVSQADEQPLCGPTIACSSLPDNKLIVNKVLQLCNRIRSIWYLVHTMVPNYRYSYRYTCIMDPYECGFHESLRIHAKGLANAKAPITGNLPSLVYKVALINCSITRTRTVPKALA